MVSWGFIMEGSIDKISQQVVGFAEEPTEMLVKYWPILLLYYYFLIRCRVVRLVSVEVVTQPDAININNNNNNSGKSF